MKSIKAYAGIVDLGKGDEIDIIVPSCTDGQVFAIYRYKKDALSDYECVKEVKIIIKRGSK